MRKYLIALVLVVGLGVSATTARAITVADLVKTIMQKAKLFCEKGSGTSQVTIRSGNGVLCKSKGVAVIASALCSHRPDFAGSQCGQNAAKVLGVTGKEPSNFLEAAKKAAAKLKGTEKKDFLDIIKYKKGLEGAYPNNADELEQIVDAAPAA